MIIIEEHLNSFCEIVKQGYIYYKEMIEEFHSRGLDVAVWTCNDYFSLSYAKSLGVD